MYNQMNLTTAVETFNFFHPINNNNVEVWAYPLKNAIENNIYENGELIFDFEIYTDEIIEYEYPFFNTNNFSKHIPISYIFTSIIEEKDTRSNMVLAFKEFRKEYTRCILKNINDVKKSDCLYLKGTITILAPFSFADSSAPVLKQSYPVALVFNNGSASAAAQNSLEKIHSINRTSNSILNNTSMHSDKIKPLTSKEDAGLTYVRIYNVGCANTVCITHHKGKKILFDCGYDTQTATYENTKNYITANIQPNIIIISHWHRDHYNILSELDYSNLEYIIFNGLENCPQNIRDNILTPFASKIIDLSQEPYDSDLLIKKGYDGIKLFIGTNSVPTSNQYGIIPHPDDVRINDSGIILCVGNLKQPFNRIILPGDASYYSWPAVPELKLDQSLSRLLVPHHGGGVYAAPGFNNQAKYKKIYVSRNSKYVPIFDCHLPNIDTCHIDFLEKGMHKKAKDFLYTKKLSSNRPFYEAQIRPD